MFTNKWEINEFQENLHKEIILYKGICDKENMGDRENRLLPDRSGVVGLGIISEGIKKYYLVVLKYS